MVLSMPEAAAGPPTPTPSFNLWSDRWIQVVRADGEVKEVGIATCLQEAHLFRAFHDISPLVTVGMQRLLAAVAQSIEDVKSTSELKTLLARGKFDHDRIEGFGQLYRHNFDLFSPTDPFLQTADVPLDAKSSDRPKAAAHLFPEIPAGTEIVHWHHRGDRRQQFCPACVAGGLVTVPAFATSGGRSFKPSINGIPPLYLLPTTQNLFQALALTIITPAFQPVVAATRDRPPWDREAVIPRGKEVLDVGYLESLTFPARRIRLFPTLETGTCTRCGRETGLLVQTMVFEMGLSRPKHAPAWFDPFAAYHLHGDQPPTPVRPVAGMAAWREFGTLFLTDTIREGKPGEGTKRPAVVDQLEHVLELDEDTLLTFRCAGMRTDQAKIFEWTESSLEVPLELLVGGRGAQRVRQGINLAQDCARDISFVFRRVFLPSGRGRGGHGPTRERMVATYWNTLDVHFRLYVLHEADARKAPAAESAWCDAVLQTARSAFDQASEEIGDRGSELRERVQARQLLTMKLGKRRKDWEG